MHRRAELSDPYKRRPLPYSSLPRQILMNGMLELQIVPWKRVVLNRLIALAPALLVAARHRPSPQNTPLPSTP